MKTQTVKTYWAKIFIAGPIDQIKQVVREYCLEGACVTVTPTTYIYAMGEEEGVEIGFINYPRFPSTQLDLTDRAMLLGYLLMNACHQGSFTVITPSDTHFVSRRNDTAK